MEKTVKCIELRSDKGKVLFSIHLWAGEGLVLVNKSSNSSSRKPGARKKKGGQKTNHQADAPMTDPQKKYLFRILADKEIEGEEAHEHLKELLQVDSLKEVSKFEAGKTIKRLLEEAKDADDGGTPF